jgi:YesN/AraC family two-component response regulator
MLKLFIVDNSELIVDRLIKALSDIKQIKIVGTANSALFAAEYIHKSNPDIVILDIHMPDGNGIDLLKQIKKESPHSAVIMLTNYPETDYKKICMEEGADFFLDKSIDFEKVIEICNDFVKQKNN